MHIFIENRIDASASYSVKRPNRIRIPSHVSDPNLALSRQTQYFKVMLVYCWAMTLGQHLTNIGSKYCVCWDGIG